MFLVAAGDMFSKLSLIPCNNIPHVTSTIRLAKRRLRGFQLSITDGSVRNFAMCLGLFAGTHRSYGIDVPWHTQARQTTVYFHYTTLDHATLYHNTVHNTTVHYTNYTILDYTNYTTTTTATTLQELHYIATTTPPHYNTTTTTTTITTTTALHHTTSRSCGEVTTATIATTPKSTTPTTFRSMSGSTLPSAIHNNQRLL